MRNPFRSQQRGTRHDDVRVHVRRPEPVHVTLRTEPRAFG